MAANKIRARSHAALQMKELVLEGIIAIVEGLNPKLIRTKLEAYMEPVAPGKAGKAKAAKVDKPEKAPSAAPAAEAAPPAA